MTEDDRDLTRRAAAGEELAFEVLVRRHTDALWRFAYATLRERTAAEDAVQETFVKAYCALGTFRGDASFRTWLFSIAHRVCIDAVRKRRHDVVSLDEARAERAAAGDAATTVALEAAVAALPPDEHKAFLLVDALGLSREEAAAVLAVPASTLKSRLARAHARLVEALDGGTGTARTTR